VVIAKANGKILAQTNDTMLALPQGKHPSEAKSLFLILFFLILILI